MKKIINIGKWKVSKELFDKYIKFSMLADGYLSGTIKTPSEELGINRGEDYVKYERNMRWQTCVKIIMETHIEICEKIGVKYTSDNTDEFYQAFHDEVRKQTRLKG